MYCKFEELLKSRGTTTYRVAKSLGFTQTMFSDWKSGKSSPKVDKLIKIANYFGVPITYFLEDLDNKQ